MRARYFIGDDQLVEVAGRPRRHVEFERHNLALDPIPPLGEVRST